MFAERAVEVRARLGVDDQAGAAGVDVLLGHHVGRVHHQVRLERHRRVGSGGGDHVGAEREVRDELAVHHVPLDEVDPGRLECGDLLAEPGEVGGQHGRGDLDRSAHRAATYPACARLAAMDQASGSGRCPHARRRRPRPSPRCAARPWPSSSRPRRATGTGRGGDPPGLARRRERRPCVRDPSTRCRRGSRDPVSRGRLPSAHCAAYAGGMLLTPDRLVAGGDALARDDDGRVVFIDGALPGEVVEVEVETSKKDFARGRIVRIVEKSPLRDSPSCSHRRAGCGGCDWMHLQPAAQFDAKVEIVRESLRRIGRLDADLVDSIVVQGSAVTPFGYRTTIRVVGGTRRCARVPRAGHHRGRPDHELSDRRVEALPPARRDPGRRGRRAHAAHLRGDRGRDGDLGQAVPQGDPRRAVGGPHRRAGLAHRADRRSRPAGVGRIVLPVRARRRPSCSSPP